MKSLTNFLLIFFLELKIIERKSIPQGEQKEIKTKCMTKNLLFLFSPTKMHRKFTYLTNTFRQDFAKYKTQKVMKVIVYENWKAYKVYKRGPITWNEGRRYKGE